MPAPARLLLALLGLTASVACGPQRLVDVTPDSSRSERPDGRLASAPADPLDVQIARVQQLSAVSRSAARPTTGTLESTDPRLAAALVEATLSPTVGALLGVAEEYRRLQVHDRAHQYLSRALVAAPKDWRVHDALARLWRDSGFPHVGLGDAYRAVYHGRREAAAWNTLGTLFQAMGRNADARREYQRAVALQPTAFYAHNNLCYTWVLDGDGDRAVQACRRALALEPTSALARNNAGLAYALTGDMTAARETFAAAGGEAAASFNTGIVRLAARQWDAASKAFLDAAAADPSRRDAVIRARQAIGMRNGGAE